MNLGVGVFVLLAACMLCQKDVSAGDKKENNPGWPYWTTTRAPYTTDSPDPAPRFDHVRRLNNMEFQFEKLSNMVAKILQIIKHIPQITGVEAILKEVQQIPQIKKILTGAVIRFPNAVYGDENAVRYYVQGHVEILHQNTWGTICDDSFDAYDGYYEYDGDRIANVLCTMGGYKSGAYHWGRYKQRYATKAPKIWLDNFYCKSGNETSIGNCRLYDGWGRTDCSHSEDAGIRCYI